MTKTTLLILLCGCIGISIAQAQQPAYTYYTLRDGLPSNDLYNCLEDSKGFLWIATENGLSKFDGKNFKNYYTAQGLPDNEILSVQMDKDGVIWVLPFQRSPAYYDEKTDKFINSTTDKELGKISFSSVVYCNPLSGGGMGFCNSNGKIFIYRNKKCETFSLFQNAEKASTRIIELPSGRFLIVSNDSLRVLQNGRIISRSFLNRKIKRTVFLNDCLYIADSATLVKIPVLPDGSTGQQVENRLPFKITTLNFTGRQLAITSGTGNIYLADTTTLAVSQQSFAFNALIRHVFEDRERNNWICTRESGLVRYQEKGILSITNREFQRNFNTIVFWNSQLAAGTNNGQIFFYKSPYNNKIITLSAEQNYTNWVRQMVPTKSGLMISEEGGLFLLDPDLGIKQLLSKEKNTASKYFMLLDDTNIIGGNSGRITVFNRQDMRVRDSAKVRVITIETSSPGQVYVGSNTGLYLWDHFRQLKYFGNSYPLLSTRINSLAYNKADEIFWIGPATDSLVAMCRNVPIAVIPLGAKLPGNNCRALFCTGKGVVWVGTNMALGKIEYRVQNNELKYSISVFTTADGIAGKQVNDITEHNDTIYVATSGGISMVPAGLHMDAPEIPVYVIGVRINNRDTVLQDAYHLGYAQNNISINFTAANIGATSERIYQYNINDGPWTTTKNENIQLQQLAPGSYKIRMTVFRRDGTPSQKMAEVNIYISTPFWKHWLFYILVMILCMTLGFYFLQRRSRLKREESVQKLFMEKRLSDLELKALKAQINPHFVFNCLNSIKYLNHGKRFEETELYLDKFSFLLRRTLDFSGLQKISLQDELEYSRNYLELEKLRLGNKLEYEIITASSLDAATTAVPPMLLQPYLENAVKHGIRQLSGDTGKIIIRTEAEGDRIICSITDNGIGIDNAKKISAEENRMHRSHGTTLQQRRAELYNISVNISPRNNNKGTVVILEMKNEQTGIL